MSYSFNARRGLIVIPAEIADPSGSIILRLALDTGATGTMVNVGPLAAVGYDPSLAAQRVQITTGSGVEYAPRILVSRLMTLGKERRGFPVLAHTLPPSAGIDGVLGLDFLRGQSLSIDLRQGTITCS